MASEPASTGAGAPTSGAMLDTLVPGGALELPDDVQFQLKEFKRLVSELKAALDAAAQQAPGPAELAAIPEPLERARLCLSLAKAVNALHHVYLRAHGRDPFAPLPGGGASVGRQELDRVRQYDKKVGRAVHDAELRASRPVLSLDVAAASRFIDAAIPDLSAEQRGALKRAAQAVEAQRGTNKKARGGPGGARTKGQEPGRGAAAGPERAARGRAEEAEADAEAEAEAGACEAAGREGAMQDGAQQADGAAGKADGAAGGGGGGGRRKGRSAADGAARGKRGTAAGGGGAGGGGALGAREAAEQFLASLAAAEGKGE